MSSRHKHNISSDIGFSVRPTDGSNDVLLRDQLVDEFIKVEFFRAAFSAKFYGDGFVQVFG